LRFLRKLNAILREIEEFVVAYGVITMAVLTIADVIGRNVFNHSLVFVPEITQFLIVFITFFGTSYAARNGRHIRMSALYDALSPSWQKAMLYITTSLTSIALFYMSYISAKYVLRVYSFNRVSSVLTIPLYLIWMWVPIGLLLAAIQYSLAFIKNIVEKEPWISFEQKAEYVDVGVGVEEMDRGRAVDRVGPAQVTQIAE